MQNYARTQCILIFLLSGLALATFALLNHSKDLHGGITLLLFMCCVVYMYIVSNNKIILKLITAGLFVSIVLMFVFGIKGYKQQADTCNILSLIFLLFYIYFRVKYKRNRQIKK